MQDEITVMGFHRFPRAVFHDHATRGIQQFDSGNGFQ
jgi:hypothetical protein